MATVTEIFRGRWKSREYIGPAKPNQRVYIRPGYFRRAYDTWEGDDVGALMPGKSRTRPWQATWTPLDVYREIPNVFQVDLEQDFDNNGIGTATIQCDNIEYADTVGLGGLFRRIIKGFLAPLRGFRPPGRPQTQDDSNEWYRYLDRENQVLVEQGYGNELVKTYTGLTEDIDLTSGPEKATITARHFALTLTDQHNLGHAKDAALANVPTVFADRLHADDSRKEGTAGPHDASSSQNEHPARFVVTASKDEYWVSDDHTIPNFTEWVQVRIPAGRYESFHLHPAYAGMTGYVSLFAKQRKGNKKPLMDDQQIDSGWVDVGAGSVPGGNGGIPYIKSWGNMSHQPRGHSFGHSFEVGDDSILRISFRNLRKVRADGQVVYHAGVRRLYGLRRQRKPEAVEQKWVLVDDLSDVVKVVFRWAGYKEWDVETTGLRLPEPLTFHNGDTLMDIIAKAQEMTNYVFFQGDPSEDDSSIGVPIFRSTRILTLGQTEQVTDRDLLTGINAKISMGGLPHIIYARGAPTESRSNSRMLGEDKTRRVTAVYRPPWNTDKRDAHIIRHFVQRYQNLRSFLECEVATRFVAMNAALQMITGTIEIPGHPGITIDSLVGILDTGTGLNSRMYVSNRGSSFVRGENAEWKMTLGGSFVDHPYVQQIALELSNLVGSREANDAVYGTVRSQGRKR